MIGPLPPISAEDREHIIRHSESAWRALAGSHLFITGGTGFYGKWMLEAIAAANDELGAGVSATILSRDPARFAAEVPHLAARTEFEWVAGEPARFAPPSGAFDYLIDFATPSALEVGAGGTAIIDHCLRGTESLLGFAKAAGVHRIVYASSGAVYGRQPPDLERMPEGFVPDPATVTPYGQLKQCTEALLLASGVDCVIARGFAFIGPYLPLTDKFAAGSFIRDALAGGPIRIFGDGSTRRAYLYGADLVVHLLHLLVKGRPGKTYNIGSEESIVLSGLASAIATAAGNEVAIEIASTFLSSPANTYVPSIERARSELGLPMPIPLDLAIRRSLDWALEASSKSALPSTAAQLNGTATSEGPVP